MYYSDRGIILSIIVDDLTSSANGLTWWRILGVRISFCPGNNLPRLCLFKNLTSIEVLSYNVRGYPLNRFLRHKYDIL
jgi:hypothetical protein